MKVEIFPYRYRDGWKNIPRYKGAVKDVYGPRGLFSIYNSGAAYRIMPDGPINTAVFHLGKIPAQWRERLAKIAYLGGEDDCIAFYALEGTCSPDEYPVRHMEAFARLSKESGCLLMPYGIPKGIEFGRPCPEIVSTKEKIVIPYIDLSETPMPISYKGMMAMFHIDDHVPLPPIQWNGNIIKDTETTIWRGIIPAAFAYYHYFTHPVEKRWGLSDTHFTFDDCIYAIVRAMHSINVPNNIADPILSGALKEAYAKFQAPRLRLFTPCGDTFVLAKAYLTPYLYASDEIRARSIRAAVEFVRRHWAEIKAKRHPPKEKGPPKYAGCTLEELNEWLAAGKIKRGTYYRIREKFGINTRERQKYEYHSMEDVEALYAAGKVGRNYYYSLRKRFKSPEKG